ncbi:MAG: ABC transporter permease [Cellulosilyticaceae bacterium]
MRKLKQSFLKIFGNEKYQGLSIPLLALFMSLIVASLVILAVGKDPFESFVSLLKGSGLLPKASYAAKKSMLTDFMSLLNSLTPMIFAALSVAVAFKTGLFNIGVSGQMLISGFVASVLIGYSELPAVVAKPAVILIGIVVGALVGALIGYLKHKFNINEVVSAIMINYILQYGISFMINMYYINPASRQSRAVSSAASLTLQNVEVGGLKMDIPLGFLLVIPVVVGVKFLLDRTRIGFEMKTVGMNKHAAKYTGIEVGKNIVLSMTLSGALAGLAGITFYLGNYVSIQPRELSAIGFDAIAVSLLGNSNPIGILGSSLLITTISKGSNYMSSTVGIQGEIAQVITGIILLFAACGVYIKYRINKAKEQMNSTKGGKV